MIISASRRTDIPAFYSDWFYKRIQERFVMVRNPMNLSQVRKVSLKREAVDCIVFWTKNPESMMERLNLIEDYPYYFQFTLNPYGTDDSPNDQLNLTNDINDLNDSICGYNCALEPGLPRKSRLIDTFKKLSDRIGQHRVIWRYDPIILNDSSINIAYHEKHFEKLARNLHKHTTKYVISFVDYYKKIDKTFKTLGIKEIDDIKKKEIAKKLSGIARSYNLKIETCAEEIDLTGMGIGHARCIDPELIASLSGIIENRLSGVGDSIHNNSQNPVQNTIRLNLQKDRNKRKACKCAASVDIGAYNTCAYGCLYCYANYSRELVRRNMMNHDMDSPILCGKTI